MFLQASKMVKIAQLNKGKRVKLSKADIVDFSINLLDTKRRVSKEKYEKILRLHKEFSKDKEKIEMDLNKYQSIINDMMKEFNDIENG